MKTFVINTDERRTLYEWIENLTFKSAKVVVVNEEIAIGDHYHRKKDEVFFLVQGKFIYLEVGAEILTNICAPYKVIVPRLTYHKFVCSKGSILCGVATEPFDPNDEIKKQ